MEEKFDIANLLQFNEEEEAKAIKNYNNLLAAVEKSELSRDHKNFIQQKVYEIVGDELNHQDVLKTLYTAITGIKENKD